MDLPRRTGYRALSFCRGQALLLPSTACGETAPLRFLDAALRRAYRYSGDGTLQGARVPVTAKLSRKFYEKLGDEVANELVEWFNSVDATYRSDLRELNELNFARFDAKVEQRWAQLDAKLEQRLAQLDAKLEQRVAELRAEM